MDESDILKNPNKQFNDILYKTMKLTSLSEAA